MRLYFEPFSLDAPGPFKVEASLRTLDTHEWSETSEFNQPNDAEGYCVQVELSW